MSLQFGDIQLKRASRAPLYRTLADIYGIGTSLSLQFCSHVGLSRSVRLGDLSSTKQHRLLSKFRQWLDSHSIAFDHEARTQTQESLVKLRSMQSYRGVRNVKGLPVRGQNTRSNARTKRRLPMRREGWLRRKVGSVDNERVTPKESMICQGLGEVAELVKGAAL